MKKNIIWFTLVELLIWILILTSVLTIISTGFIQIHKSIYQANYTTKTFQDLFDFNIKNQVLWNYIDSFIINWNYDWVVLEYKNKYIVFGVFEKNQEFYKYSTDNNFYWNNYFWFFYITKKQFEQIKIQNSFENINFISWDLLKNVFVKNIKISKNNLNQIIVDLEILKYLNTKIEKQKLINPEFISLKIFL